MKILRCMLILTVVTGLGPMTSLPVYAGPYTDALSNCLASSTTPEDKLTFVKWMFAAMSRHPAVKSMANVSDAQLIDANQKVAALYMRLMTEQCKDMARAAVKNEGKAAVNTSFQVVGQVAAEDLFSNPEVAKVMSSLDTYIDSKKLHEALGDQ